MDILAQLALMTKAMLVFDSPETFLSFPALMPISYTPDQMNFVNATSSQQLHIFSEFSTFTNALPEGTLFQPSPDHLLWDVYQGLLQNAQVAQGSLTTQQATELQSARAFLTVQDPDGLLVDSPAVVAYKQYQQDWFAATQNYNNGKITASASSDPSVQAQWQNNGEPLARAQVEAAESDWETKGFKAQVEQAQQIEHTYAAQSPQLEWQSWVALCNPTTDFLTDPTTSSSFGPTVFAPYDVFDHGTWPSFSIAGSEIANLVNQAPPELRNIFGATSGDSSIESLSFEYCSVALSRTWFRPDLFSARFWRLSDPTVQLSDGLVPPHGNWPAYITAVIFARNIVVTTSGAGQPQPLRTFPLLRHEILNIEAQPIAKPTPILLRPRVAVAPQAVVTSQPMSKSTAVRVAPVAQPRFVAPIESATSVAGQAGVSSAQFQAEPAVAISPALRARLSAATFSGRNAQTTVPPPTETQSSGNEISVLAFICKRLPKCPDPDSTLNWG